MTGLGWFLVIVLIVVGVVLYLGAQARKKAAAEPGLLKDPLRKDARGIDPRRIKVGDVVAHEGRDFLVRGTLSFDQDGFRWQEHHLDDTSVRRWLSVEDDEELELVLWHAVDGLGLEPGADEVTHDGVAFRRDEHGTATFAAAGSTGTAPAGTVEYYDYAAGDRRLSFERYGSIEEWEVGVGEVVNERSLDIYPTSPSS
jgi:hypothetical protein